MNIFEAIAASGRRNLLQALLHGPRTVTELVSEVGMQQPVTSKHLRLLKEAGYVTVQPKGQQRLYALNPAPFQELEQWLAPYRAFMADRFDALADHLDSQETES